MDSKIFAILKKVPQRTQLSALSDLEQTLDDASMLITGESMAQLDNFSSDRQTFLDLKSDLNIAAADLYDTLQNWDYISDQLGGVVINMENAINQYSDLSNELGIDPTSNAVYTDTQFELKKISELINQYETAMDSVDFSEIDRLSS